MENRADTVAAALLSHHSHSLASKEVKAMDPYTRRLNDGCCVVSKAHTGEGCVAYMELTQVCPRIRFLRNLQCTDLVRKRRRYQIDLTHRHTVVLKALCILIPNSIQNLFLNGT